ncbi:unnamed protein product [Linum tenue]|uniref:Uncharacterized protein n=1 Tax=Linum tenue TaxID=586396 RepID=A0AAV0KJT8_9ROSI|nr:unnamed protein product [Linum tenue]
MVNNGSNGWFWVFNKRDIWVQIYRVENKIICV